MRKIFIKIMLSLGILAICIIGAGKYLLNQQVVKEIVEDYLVQTAQPWADQGGVSLVLDDFSWGGFTHPFSFNVATIDVKGLKNDLAVRGEKLRIGLKAAPLLLGHIHFSQLHCERIILKRHDQSLGEMSVKGQPSWQGHTLLVDGKAHEFGQLAQLIPTSFQWPDIHEVSFHASFTIIGQTITGNEIHFQKEDVSAHSSFSIQSDRPWTDLWHRGGNLDVKVTGHVKDLAVNDIPHVWPEALAFKPRTWVTQNLKEGSVPLATLKMTSQVKLEQQGCIDEVTLTQLEGDIDAQGVTVHYLRPMAPVLKAQGKCHYTAKDFFIDACGEVTGIKLIQSHLHISDLDQEDQMMDIELENEGPLDKCLQLLKSEPLDLTRHIGIDGADIQGHAHVHTTLHFPLMMDLPLEQVDVIAKATLTKGQILFAQGLTTYFPVKEGTFNLDVTKSLFTLKGKAKIAGYPSDIHWEQFFDKKASPCQQRLHVKSCLEWPQGEDFGGKIPLECSLEKKFNGKSQGSLHLDFDQFSLGVPWVLWDKKSGQRGHGDVKWSFKGEEGTLEKCDFIAPELDIRATGKLDGHGLKNLDFSIFRLGTLTPKVKVHRNSPEFYCLNVHLKHVDLSGLLHELDVITQSKGDFSLPVDLALDVTIDQLVASDTYKLGQVHGDIRWLRDHLGLIEIKGDTMDHTPFVFRLTPGKIPGKQEFNLQTSRAGELLELFGTGYDMEGGDMIMVGHKTTQNDSWMLEGEVQLKDLVVRQAPLLAHLLSATSFQGIVHLLTGKGIRFSHGYGYFHLSPAVLAFSKAELSGAALGVFFQGQLNRMKRYVNFVGEIVPIYAMNQLMANIPLFGQVLSGGHQEGIFRTDFNVIGPQENPEVKVNALTTIAPGGVRAALTAGENAMKKSQRPVVVPGEQSLQPLRSDDRS